MKSPYTIVILWSDEDQCYLVHLPEFPTQKFHTHGDTYEEALKNAQEVLQLLIEAQQSVTLLEDELLEVRFIYLEPERQLLRIQLNRFPFDFNTY